MAWNYQGNVSLIPLLSDTYYSLLIDLVETSKREPGRISYPAGAVIIAVACLESYINELIQMTSFSQTEAENNRLKRKLRGFGTDLIKKLTELKTLAKKADKVSDDLMERFKLLYGLRGLLVHYEVQEEKPNDPGYSSRLEALERRLFKNQQQQGDFSIERILTSGFAQWVRMLVFDLIDALYRAGYEPPRGRWVELIDPGRFGPKS